MPFTQPVTQELDTIANETNLDVFLPCTRQRLIIIRQQIERLNQAPFGAAREANLQCLYMQLSALEAMISERLREANLQCLYMQLSALEAMISERLREKLENQCR